MLKGKGSLVMQLFALTTSHFGQFSQHLRRVADIFSSFQCECLESTSAKRTGSSLKQQRAARGPDRSHARRPGPSVRGVATWRRQDIACFSGPTYTNPPQIRKRRVRVIFAPPNFWITSLGSSIGDRGEACIADNPNPPGYGIRDNPNVGLGANRWWVLLY